MRILYCGLKYTYLVGTVDELIYEHVHFVPIWKQLGYEVDEINIGRVGAIDPEFVNKELLERAPDYDMVWCTIYTDQIRPETLRALKGKTLLVGFQTDDNWRFQSISLEYGPVFDWWVTTWANRLPDYEKYPDINPVYMPWGVNTSTYKKLDIATENPPQLHWFGDIYGDRAEKIEQINKEIPVARHPFSPLTKLIENMNKAYSVLNLASCVVDPKIKGIKGRLFEVPATGTLLISEYAPGSEEYYEDGKEIVTFRTIPEAIEKTRYYLDHTEEGEKIAEAGRQRTLKDHTYTSRFKKLFGEIL
jgi:hypothetical protein